MIFTRRNASSSASLLTVNWFGLLAGTRLR